MRPSEQWIKGGLFVIVFWVRISAIQAQTNEPGVDTTGIGYRIGYEIGSWLPFIIIFILALLVIYNSYRFSSKKKK